MLLIDGSVLVWKESKETWAFTKGKEFSTHPIVTEPTPSGFEYRLISDGWEVYWLPEGLL